MFYTARDGDNPLKLQLHRVGLDGRGDVRLTDPKFHHTVGSCMAGAAGGRGRGGAGSCGIAADNKHFVDVYQTHNTPPATRLVDAASGKVVADVVASDLTKFEQLGLKKAELFTFKAADGQTTLHGLIQFPSTFDPSRKYPVLVQVYGGPASASNTARETFVTPSPLTEYGFLVVNVDSRAAPGRGKRLLDQIYLKLGQVEIDDMAAGVRSLGSRPYVDAARVGIFGTSYGGYSSVMSLLRHPDVYAAASASSPVTAWNHYDTHLHRALHVDPAGEQGRLRRRQRDDLRQGSQGPPDAVLGDRRQQRPPVEHDAAHYRAAGGRQELRRAGRAGPRPQRHQYRSHDGVLHRGAEGAVGILMDPRLIEILERLRASRFAEVKGARASLSIPVSGVAPERADRGGAAAGEGRFATCRCGRRRATAWRCAARASRLDFLPPVTISLQIEQQPQLPDTPLVVRILSLPGLLSVAGSLLSPSSLPPGIRLDRERVLVDVRQLLERKGFGEIVPLIERLHVSSEEGRLLLDVDLRA